MITKPTVLILGAGASAPYKFPTGRELVDRICKLHPTYVRTFRDGDQSSIDFPYHPAFQGPALGQFQNALRMAVPPSIDSFLSSNPQFAVIGRPAIAAVLIPCEDLGTLLNVSRNEDWYLYLRDQMGNEKDEFLESADNLSIITFNYDRSLEYYFHARLTAYHGDQGINMVRRMRIVHVYGQLGTPDFLLNGAGTMRSYKSQLDHVEIERSIAEIKIISDYQEDSAEFRTARDWIASARTVCFLGFGYDPKNLERLQLDKCFRGRRIFGSAKGFTPNELKRLRQRFTGNIAKTRVKLSKKIEFGLPDQDALNFLRNSDVLG